MSEIDYLIGTATTKIVNTCEEAGNFNPADSDHLKSVRKYVRSNDDNMKNYTIYLIGTMERASSDRRSIIISLLDYFFVRSHACRLAVMDLMQDLLRLVCETEPLRYPLPGPKESAQKLKVHAIKILKAWHTKFAVGYTRLQLVCPFLQMSKTLDYNETSGQLLAEAKRKEEEERNAERKAATVAEHIKKAYSEFQNDISNCLTEIDSALHILVPTLHDDEEETCSTETGNARLHGITEDSTVTVVISLNAPTLKITEENCDLVQAVLDARVMLDSYQNKISNWLQKLSSVGARQNIVKNLIDMKTRISSTCQKMDELKLPDGRKAKRDEDDEDSDFEDVPEKTLEDFVQPNEVPEYIMKAIAEDQPCCSKSIMQPEGANIINKSIPESSSSNKEEVPVLPFGLDLKYWTEKPPESIEVPLNTFDSHRFWRAPDDQGTMNIKQAAFTTRTFTFIGESNVSAKQCKVPLANGKLCPRRDATRCPMHGSIIERDDQGFPVAEIISQQGSGGTSTKDDDDFLRDVEAAVGRDLGSNKPKGKKKSTNEKQTVRNRLEKKLLDKRSLKRISDTMNAIRNARIQKKFGHQFIHAVSNK